ncbi:hypothetical protein JCM6882_001299 [Rhodosporidiobolus microsporus]
MDAQDDRRPKTASRPRTARPTTAAGQPDAWAEEDYESEEDDDVGMFSFMRPQTGDPSQAHTSPPTTAPFTPYAQSSPYTNPYSPNPFGFSPHPSIPPSTAAPSEPARPRTAVSGSLPPISPAAAYAMQMQAGSIASPPNSYQPNSPEPQAGPRKRGSWQSPDSPNHVVGNPYEQQLRREPSRRTSDGSSRDKIDALRSGWADQQQGPPYTLDANGQAIMLDELGEPLRAATSREQKLIDEVRMGESVDYHDTLPVGGPEYFEEDEEDSPYPEVRASVSNIDDPEMPVLTFRSWTIGLLFCIVIAALNCFFNLRYPAPLITPIITQVLSYPFGKLLARFLPIASWRTPQWTRRFGVPELVSINPGPFNIKEHTVLVIMANISTAPAFAVNFSLMSDKYYGIAQGVGFDILLVLTTQLLGFGAAGLCRRFLVWPAAMIWPQNLVFCTLLNTLHAEDEDQEKGPSRFRFFIYVISGAFIWYWIPGYLFVALSAFSWVCWIKPNNVVVNQLFGVSSGLGMGLFTFDWSQIAYLNSPLVVPWWAEVNIFCGFALAFWLIAPIMYYTNVWNSAYLPISTSSVFDRFGAPYNTSAVVNAGSASLNETAYHEYSPLFLPITYATTYGLAFMLSTSAIVHTALYHGKNIWMRVMRAQKSEDVHMKLMKNYPEVPDWWYLITLVVSLALTIVAVACWDTQMPVWAVIVSILLALVYLIPGGFIYAMTSTQITINLMSQLIAGYITPEQPLANALFKTYAMQSLGQSLSFVQDLKLGHYMKIPPRATFIVQLVSAAVTCFVQVGVKRWLVSVVPDLCDARQEALLTCPNVRVMYSSSVVWGLIGPARQFAPGKMYNPILYWLLAGAILPILTWLLARRYPNSWVSHINVPVALAGAVFMPPATGINFSSWFLVGFIFQYIMRHRHFRWWSKFNFVLSAGMDAGTVLSGIMIFLCLYLPKNGTIALNWWGNTVYTETLDWQGVSYKTPPPEGFGPTTW